MKPIQFERMESPFSVSRPRKGKQGLRAKRRKTQKSQSYSRIDLCESHIPEDCSRLPLVAFGMSIQRLIRSTWCFLIETLVPSRKRPTGGNAKQRNANGNGCHSLKNVVS